jgi:two-component system, cell cycle sensor histidine kinase and response regulator CckA
MGTVFKIYFPCVHDRAQTVAAPVTSDQKSFRGSETLLLVEDEDALRRATAEFLSLNGYTVLQARDGREAVSVADQHASAIDLVVTDVVMPHVSGGELAKQLATIHPETRFLFPSGYAGQTVLDHKVVDLESNFLQKPFTLKQLAGKVRSILDQHAEIKRV